MDLHQNPRLTWRSRETLANKIVIEKLTSKAAAAAFNVSRKPPSGFNATAPWACPVCGIVPHGHSIPRVESRRNARNLLQAGSSSERRVMSGLLQKCANKPAFLLWFFKLNYVDRICVRISRHNN